MAANIDQLVMSDSELEAVFKDGFLTVALYQQKNTTK